MGRKFNKRVKRAINKFAERKYYDYSAQTSVPAAGQFFYFNSGIGQGVSAVGARIGNEIYARSLKIRLNYNCYSSFDPIFNTRIIIGCWKNYQSSTPSATQLLENVTSFYDISPFGRLNLQDKKWIPMYDRTFITANSSTAGNLNEKTEKYITLKFNGKRLPMKRHVYNSANYPQNVYFMWVGNQAINLSYPVMNVWSRFTYTDV